MITALMKLRILAVAVVVGIVGWMGVPAVANSAALYKLPYPGGASYYVTQGGGRGGHVGTQHYAIDFGMPVGSTIAAARGGTVKYVKEDSNVCGCSSYYGNSGNYVVIDHGDGTQALYLHLQYNGALVRPGQKVAQGQPIAKSGMTGWTCGSAAGGCGPHLHFQVERAGIWFTQSLWTSFADVLTNGGVVLGGRTYKSGNYFPSPAPTPTPPPSPAPSMPRAESWVSHQLPATMSARAVVTATVTLKNVGTETWTTSGEHPYHLSYRWFPAGSSQQHWETGIELRTALPAAVAPGQTVSVPLKVRVPSWTGAYVLKVDMVQDGVAWFGNIRGNVPLSVAVAVQ